MPVKSEERKDEEKLPSDEQTGKTSDPASTKKTEDLSRFRPSRLLERFAQWFYVLITSGFFGRIFTAYSKEDEFFRNIFKKRIRQKNVHGQPKSLDRRVATLTERFFGTAFLKKVRYAMLKCPFGYYGDAVLFYAIVSLLAGFLRLFLSSAPSLVVGTAIANYAVETAWDYLSYPSFWVNLILILLSSILILPLRSRSLHEIKTESFILSAFFERLLGAKGALTEELRNQISTSERSGKNRSGRLFLILIGALAGALSAFVSPFYILLVPLILILAAIIIQTPEAGLVLSVLLMPFMVFLGRYDSLYIPSTLTDVSFFELLKVIGIPTLVLTGVVLFTIFSYLIKVLRKKRLFYFDLLDAVLLLLGVTVLFYGFIPSFSLETLSEALLFVAFLGVYFLAVNLLRTEAWIDRVISALQFTLFLSLSVAIIVYYLGVPDLGWLSTEHITGQEGNIAALFGGEDILGGYLVLMFPLSLGTVFTVRFAACKIFAAMCLPEILFVSLLMESKIPLCFCLFGLLVFALLCTHKTLYAAPLACFAAGVTYQLIPNGRSLPSFLKGFLYETFGQSVFVWDRLFTASFEFSLFGMGFGEIRYAELFEKGDPYLEGGFALRLLFGMGLPGIFVFLLFAFVLCQMCFEELKQSRGSHFRIGVAGSFTALLAVFGYGIFMPIFSDVRMIFLFWLMVGLATAYRRVSSGRRNDRSFLRQEPMTAQNADMIVF